MPFPRTDARLKLLTLGTLGFLACEARSPEGPEEVQEAEGSSSGGDASEPSDAPPEGDASSKLSDLRPYAHPLKGVAAPSGLLAGAVLTATSADTRLGVEAGLSVGPGGAVSGFQGLRAHARRKMSPGQIAAIESRKTISASRIRAIAASPPPAKIDPDLNLSVVSTPPDALLDLVVILPDVDRSSLTARLLREVSLGNVSTVGDYERLRLAFLAQDAVENAQVQAPVTAAVESMGGQVVYAETLTTTLHVKGTASLMKALAARDDVILVGRERKLTPASDPPVGVPTIPVDNVLVSNVAQIDQYKTFGYEGDGEVAAVLEVDDDDQPVNDNQLFVEHPAFDDGTGDVGDTHSRFANAVVDCGSASCSVPSPPIPSPLSGHGTAVMGLIFGNASLASEPVDPLEWDQKSGLAPRAEGYYVHMHPDTAATLPRGFEHLVTLDPRPTVVNLSAGLRPIATSDCNGTNAADYAVEKAADATYDAGLFVVAAAGNDGHVDVDECQVLAPATAMGTFAVGSYGMSDALFSDPPLPSQFEVAAVSVVKSGLVGVHSARGGAPAHWDVANQRFVGEGMGRSVVDMLSVGYRKFMYDQDPSDAYGHEQLGTSYAAPVVSAGALLFRQFFTTNIAPAELLSPGIMFANMLLMGDGTASDGSLVDTGFDSVTGAGRFEMRMLDPVGIGAPGDWRTGFTCVGEYETVRIAVNAPGSFGESAPEDNVSDMLGGPGVSDGDPIPAGVDAIKAVAYWFDAQYRRPRPTSGAAPGVIDDLELVLIDVDIPLEENGVVDIYRNALSLDDDETDNKARVYARDDLEGRVLALELSGWRVNSDADEALCGKNHMLVYWAYAYESDDRTDPLGPGPEIDPLRG